MNSPPPQRVPLVDIKTGFITREWVKWFDQQFGISSPITATDSDGITFEVATSLQNERVNGLERGIAALLQEPKSQVVPAPADEIPTWRDEIEYLKMAVQTLQQAITP
jgi:hypothetical protein